MLAIDFMRLLTEVSLRDHTLPEAITKILSTEWNPYDDKHANTIYYISGAMLKPVDKFKKQKDNSMACGLKYLKKAVTLSNYVVKSNNHPIARVRAKEEVALTYTARVQSAEGAIWPS